LRLIAETFLERLVRILLVEKQVDRLRVSDLDQCVGAASDRPGDGQLWLVDVLF
jgi:hypothetical protein